MSDSTQSPQEQDAAQEAAQHVVDEVTSWEYSGDKERVSDELDQGLSEAGVTLDGAEKERVVEEIDDLKGDETAGTPQVKDARPAE